MSPAFTVDQALQADEVNYDLWERDRNRSKSSDGSWTIAVTT